jgi:hypothetical protein
MRCSFIKPNKKQCSANAMKNSKYCFTHNPATKEAKKAAVTKGGKISKKKSIILLPVDLAEPKDVVKLLAITINEVRKGVMELRQANCIGYLSGHLIKTMETASLEERILNIEKALNSKKI